MNQSWVLIDGGTGLHVGWYFWLRVLDEVNRCARYGAPFGLLLLEPAPAPGASRRAVHEALTAVSGAVRTTDLAGLVAPGRAAVLLPEQEAAAAETARVRILERLTSHAPAEVSWRTELYRYPDHGAEISNLLTRGQADGPEPARRIA